MRLLAVLGHPKVSVLQQRLQRVSQEQSLIKFQCEEEGEWGSLS